MTGQRSVVFLLPCLIAAAPLTAQNPWTRVPAFPTVCYTAGDPFPDQLEAAMAVNQNAIGRQEQINKALCDKSIIREDFPAFLTKFKAHMIGTYLPSLDNQTAMQKTTLEMAGVSTRDYQPTEPLQAVARYAEYARTVYALRQSKVQGL